jgi:hypothetical protein
MRIHTLLLCLVPFSLVACSGDDVDPAAPGPGEFAADFKTNPEFFTNMSGPVRGTSPHGTQQTWYSSNIELLIEESAFTVPEGTVAIKEFDMMSTGSPDGYAVMVKKPSGYDSANNDWHYEMRMLDGTLMADPPAGKIQVCIDCHSAAAQTDYLAATRMQ